MPLASQRESNRINGLSWGHLSKVCGLALRSRSRSMRGRRMSMDESGGGELDQPDRNRLKVSMAAWSR